VALLASGCGPVAQRTATPLPSGTLAERLSAALGQDREDEFLDNFAVQHDASADGRQWFTVLRHGTSAAISQVDDDTITVRTSEHGDVGPGTVTLTLELDASGRIRAVAAGAHRPVWVLGPIEITDATHGTLYSAGLDAASRRQWAGRLNRAVAAVAEDRPPGADDWSKGLVVEIPADAAGFQAVTGESPSSASAITACDTGTPRIVVNPAILHQPDEWLDSTMVHEAVHVATGSPCRSGSSLAWAVEGLAESVAASSDPVTASRNRGLVLAYLREHPVPRSLPTDLGDLTGYALAQLAVDQARAHLGAAAGDLLNRANGDAGSISRAQLRRITGWYVAELERLAASG
jgi:hypothetical protein